MTCEPIDNIDIIYFTLGTGNYEFKCYEGHMEFWGRPLLLYCTICNRFWVHYMDSRTRLDARGLIGSCWYLDLVDLAKSHGPKSNRHTLGYEHQEPNLMPTGKLKKCPKSLLKFPLADCASIKKETNLPTNKPLFWL